jgi:hypothetical protein
LEIYNNNIFFIAKHIKNLSNLELNLNNYHLIAIKDFIENKANELKSNNLFEQMFLADLQHELLKNLHSSKIIYLNSNIRSNDLKNFFRLVIKNKQSSPLEKFKRTLQPGAYDNESLNTTSPGEQLHANPKFSKKFSVHNNTTSSPDSPKYYVSDEEFHQTTVVHDKSYIEHQSSSSRKLLRSFNTIISRSDEHDSNDSPEHHEHLTLSPPRIFLPTQDQTKPQGKFMHYLSKGLEFFGLLSKKKSPSSNSSPSSIDSSGQINLQLKSPKYMRNKLL